MSMRLTAEIDMVSSGMRFASASIISNISLVVCGYRVWGEIFGAMLARLSSKCVAFSLPATCRRLFSACRLMASRSSSVNIFRTVRSSVSSHTRAATVAINLPRKSPHIP